MEIIKRYVLCYGNLYYEFRACDTHIYNIMYRFIKYYKNNINRKLILINK